MVKNTVRESRAQVWRTIGYIILLCFWVFVSVVAIQFVVGPLMVKLIGVERFNKPVWTATFAAITYTLAMVLVVMVPLLIKRKLKNKYLKNNKVKKKLSAVETRMELGLVGLPTWTDLGLAPVGFIVSLILSALLVGFFSLFPWFDAEQTQNVGFSIFMSGGERVIAFLTLVVLAPIAEEVIFRGWLYGKIRNRLLDKIPEIWGIIVSTLVVSILFGIVHLQWNVGVTVFALSVVLCLLRELTGTIYAGVLTHMIKNGVAFFLLYVFVLI